MESQADLADLRERAGEVSGLLKLLAHPNRLLVACELMEGERSVSQIEARTGVRQPNLSRDLARLRAERLVTTRRQAKQVFYALADARVRTLVEALCAAFGADLKSRQTQEISS
jgi:ArsR family transcriptional regulator